MSPGTTADTVRLVTVAIESPSKIIYNEASRINYLIE